MDFNPVLLFRRRPAMIAAGLWRDVTIDEAMQRALKECPEKTAIVSWRQGRAEPERLSYRELDDRVDRIARGLALLGVGAGDIVSFQLPNGWEFVTLWLACGRLGACANPVMPIFRRHELEFMLNLGESKVFVVPKRYRGFDHEAMALELQQHSPHLRQVVVVDGEKENS